MKAICEMLINEVFRLSSGYIAIVGRLNPDIEGFLPNNCSADLYIAEKKIMRINIVGEDRFSGVDEAVRQGKRSLRTDSDIPKNLCFSKGAKLVIFETR